jgi:hypothetical protein
MVRRSIFEKIFLEMQNMRHRLDDLEKNFSAWNPQPLKVSGSELFSLPDHLRKTYVIVASEGECDATNVSSQTGRCRAIESNYLNQLTRMGWLSKRRVSKTIHFRPISEKILKKASYQNAEEPKAN